MARDKPTAGKAPAMPAQPFETPEDPGRTIEGYRGARRRLVARVAISGVGPWASAVMLALVATSALVAGAFGIATG